MMFFDAQSQLKSAKILPGYRYHKDGAVFLRELLKKESISRTDAHYNAASYALVRKLLKKNLVADHSGYITFHSTVMKRFCEENSALWEGK
jgi:hypothetical protein